MSRYVLHGVDESDYQDFWPFAALCIKRLGMTPVLFRITSENKSLHNDGFGLVWNIQSVDGYSSRLQSQLVRLWGAQFFSEKTVIISDIDMFLFNKNYFTVTLPHELSIVNISCDAYGGVNERLPMCYTVGRGKAFKKALNLELKFNDFLKTVINTVGNNWNSDEYYLTQKLRAYPLFTGRRRGWDDQGVARRRIDRLNWTWNHSDIDKYIDCHVLRPYKGNEKSICKLLDAYKIDTSMQALNENFETQNEFLDDGSFISEQQRIPKIFHTIWLGGSPMPREYIKHIYSWIEMHPGWTHMHWCDTKLPEIKWEHLFSSGSLIHKIDIVRFELFKKYGGVYIDVDTECHKNIEELIYSFDGFISSDDSGRLCSAVMGFVPNHEFVDLLVKKLPSRAPYKGNALFETGIMFVAEFLNKFITFNGQKTAMNLQITDDCRDAGVVYTSELAIFAPWVFGQGLRAHEDKDRFATHYEAKSWQWGNVADLMI